MKLRNSFELDRAECRVFRSIAAIKRGEWRRSNESWEVLRTDRILMTDYAIILITKHTVVRYPAGYKLVQTNAPTGITRREKTFSPFIVTRLAISNTKL